jgi:hypothetical protein
LINTGITALAITIPEAIVTLPTFTVKLVFASEVRNKVILEPIPSIWPG